MRPDPLRNSAGRFIRFHVRRRQINIYLTNISCRYRNSFIVGGAGRLSPAGGILPTLRCRQCRNAVGSKPAAADGAVHQRQRLFDALGRGALADHLGTHLRTEGQMPALFG